MEIKISNGVLEVAGSGSVLGHVGTPMLFTLKENGESLAIKFHFVSDTNIKEAHIRQRERTSSTLEVDFVNFDNALGAGTTRPLLMGKIANRSLHLGFWVVGVGGKESKLVHYTWYLGERVNG